MSRVHDALRKAAQQSPATSRPTARPAAPPAPPQVAPTRVETPPNGDAAHTATAVLTPELELDSLDQVLETVQSVPYNPLAEALLVDLDHPREAPSEEFRSLRTRLNHLQTLQPLHALVVTSASPGEGKSFTATNLAISQAQLADKRVLLADFDFRRPSIFKTFQISSSPGIRYYLRAKASHRDAIRRIGDTNLYVMTAGEGVTNPL
jgi:protein-tyrosine kinase